jgi:peptidoglycan/LPS O-acetylase OafA/YrhL
LNSTLTHPLVLSRPVINFNLEALRGLDALVVVWHHVIFNNRLLDPGFSPTGILAYNPPGHFAVLIFFLLSGYVIGVSNPNPMQVSGIRTYLRKRFTRLYPIYVVAVLAGVVAAGFTIPLSNIAAHLVFLQGLTAPVMLANNPLWSLSFEVVFYLLFIPLSLLAVRPWIVALAATILGVGFMAFGQTAFLGSYFIGFSFWALGWALSDLRVQPGYTQWPRTLSSLLLLLGIEYLNPLATAGNKLLIWIDSHPALGLDSKDLLAGMIDVSDYAYLPYAASIILVAAGVGGRVARLFHLLLLLLPLYSILYVIRHLHEPFIAPFLIPCLLYLLSLALYFSKVEALSEASRSIVQTLIPVGSISYGLYVIHFPIMTLFHQVTAFSGSPLTFTVRAVLYVALCLLAAYLLDKKFHPWIKKYIS